ncbi:hypothetical protein FRC03_004744 [Tulasnella sp. 419]|nr:hypothetical protein FRC03_004744 [Tulasnella sp. 419]
MIARKIDAWNTILAGLADMMGNRIGRTTGIIHHGETDEITTEANKKDITTRVDARLLDPMTGGAIMIEDIVIGTAGGNGIRITGTVAVGLMETIVVDAWSDGWN